MFDKQPQVMHSKAKWLSTYLMAFVLLLSAGVTFHGEPSLAAKPAKASGKKKQQPKAASKGQAKKKGGKANNKKRKMVRRNQPNPSGVFALYQNPLFGYGKCLPSLQESAQKVLSRNGIDTVSANDKEKAALAIGIAQVERLLGKPIPSEYRYDYQWKNASGPWNSGISRVGYVTVKRLTGSIKGQLTGRMMHELGHRFGHANENENYNEYRAHMRGKKCMITTYCGKSLNEEFAEAFEAYVVNPDFLAKHCPDSYNYFKTKLFRNPEALLVSCEDPNSVLDHDHEDDDDAVEDTDEQQIDENKDFTLPTRGPVPVMNPRLAPQDVGANSAASPVTTEPAQQQEVLPAISNDATTPVEEKVTQQEVSSGTSAAESAPATQQQEGIQQQAQVVEEQAKNNTAAVTSTRKFRRYTLPAGSKVPVPAGETE